MSSRKTITLPDPPSSWMELNKEQMIYIHTLPASEMPESVFRLKAFLFLAGLELCGESFYEEPEATAKSEEDVEGQMQDIEAQLKWMESVMSGEAEISVVLKKKTLSPTLPHNGEGEPDGQDSQTNEEALMVISDKDLYEAAMHFTEFITKPYDDFTAQPLGDIQIGTHIYKTPEWVFSNLTYEQYSQANQTLSNVWNANEELQELQQQLVTEAQKHAKRQESIAKARAQVAEKEGRAPEEFVPEEFVASAELIAAIDEQTNAMKEAQAEFCAHLLTPLHPVVRESAVLDDKGNPTYDKGGKPMIKQTVYMEPISKNVDQDTLLYIEEIKENMPIWLYPILYKHFQSSLMDHKKRFSKLFAEKKVAGETNSDPLVSQVSTINTLMKEQGYMSQQDVLDANAVFNFQKLDELTRRAEEMDKMNKEMKRKSKRH